MNRAREFQTEVSDEIFWRAYRRFWWKDWPRHVAVYALVTAVFVWVWRRFALDSGVWFYYAAAAGLTAAWLIGDYWRYQRANAQMRNKFGHHRLTYRFGDDIVSVESDLGTIELKWGEFRGVIKYADMWLLMIGKNAYLILPTDGLDADVAAFVDRSISGSAATVGERR